MLKRKNKQTENKVILKKIEVTTKPHDIYKCNQLLNILP